MATAQNLSSAESSPAALVDVLALPLLVGLGHLVDFLDLHGGVDDAVLGLQGDLLADLDILIGVQGHGDGPEGAVGHEEFLAHALPVGLAHETAQRREATDAHHDQVALGAIGNVNGLQAGSLFLLGFQLGAFQQGADQALATMGGNQFRHLVSPFKFWLFQKNPCLCPVGRAVLSVPVRPLNVDPSAGFRVYTLSRASL